MVFGLAIVAHAADVTPQLYVTFDGSLSGNTYMAGAGEIINGTLSLKNGTEILDEGLLKTAGGAEALHFLSSTSLAMTNAENETMVGTSFIMEGMARLNGDLAGFDTLLSLGSAIAFRYLNNSVTDTHYHMNGTTSTGWKAVNAPGPQITDAEIVHYALIYEYVSETEATLSLYVNGEQFGETLTNTTPAGGDPDGVGMMFGGEVHPSAPNRGMPCDLDMVAFSTFTGTFNPETDFVLPDGPGSAALASNQNPANNATDVLLDSILSWTSGQFAVEHSIYVGESFEDVNTASVPTASGLDVNSFDPGRF